MATLEQCQRSYDAMTPEEEPDNSCPICGSVVDIKDLIVTCKDCGFTISYVEHQDWEDDIV